MNIFNFFKKKETTTKDEIIRKAKNFHIPEIDESDEVIFKYTQEQHDRAYKAHWRLQNFLVKNGINATNCKKIHCARLPGGDGYYYRWSLFDKDILLVTIKPFKYEIDCDPEKRLLMEDSERVTEHMAYSIKVEECKKFGKSIMSHFYDFLFDFVEIAERHEEEEWAKEVCRMKSPHSSRSSE